MNSSTKINTFITKQLRSMIAQLKEEQGSTTTLDSTAQEASAELALALETNINASLA